jgi:hypothetical protein
VIITPFHPGLPVPSSVLYIAMALRFSAKTLNSKTLKAPSLASQGTIRIGYACRECTSPGITAIRALLAERSLKGGLPAKR